MPKRSRSKPPPLPRQREQPPPQRGGPPTSARTRTPPPAPIRRRAPFEPSSASDEDEDEDEYLDVYEGVTLPPDADASVGGIHVVTAWRSLTLRAAVAEGLGVFEDEEEEPRFELEEAKALVSEDGGCGAG